MSNCCGLKALERIIELKEVSMFTLIHLAKDNGLNLYFCKVEPEELVQVARPAIFHQKDHFVFIENGEPMPNGEYDGYVLTSKPLHEPLPFSLAKKVRGRKGGGFAKILQPIAIGLASVINPVLGAVVGAGFGGARAGGAFGDEGKGEWWRIGTGAISGALGAKSPGLSALSAAAGEVPRAIKTGNWMGPIGAGLGQYGANVFSSGLGQGIANAPVGTSVLGKATAGIKGGVNAITSGVQRLAGGTPSATPAGGVQIAPNAINTEGLGYTDSFRLTGALPGRTAAGSMLNLPGIGAVQSSAAKIASGASSSAASSGFGFKDILGLGLTGAQLLGMGATTLINPPKYESNIGDNFSKAAEYLGNDNYSALPKATRSQLDKYTNMSLQDLSKEFYAPDDKGLRTLQENKQRQIDSIMVSYANYGQDPYSSSEAQQKLTEINRQYDQATSEYQQQIQNNAMSEAIKFKQDILAKSMEQGNFDYESAMELATHIGLDQQYKYAMQTKNYEVMQDILSQIFSIGQYNSNRRV